MPTGSAAYTSRTCSVDHLGPNGRSEHLTYPELTATKRLWCEPGLGIVDFHAVLAVLPPDYDGDFMIEIDEPSIESPLESYRMSYAWARQNLQLG